MDIRVIACRARPMRPPARPPGAEPPPGGPAARRSGSPPRGASPSSTVAQQGEATAQAAMMGRADPHALVRRWPKVQLAIETAVTLRDRVVEAYQEILRMQV
jgi:flagellar hook-basal body complex protein FliE